MFMPEVKQTCTDSSNKQTHCPLALPALGLYRQQKPLGTPFHCWEIHSFGWQNPKSVVWFYVPKEAHTRVD
jgi:hypothetical protein